MDTKKIGIIAGVVLMLVGTGLTSFFFIRNQINERDMVQATDEFMEILYENTEEIPDPNSILLGDTVGVIEFPKFNNQQIAIKDGATNKILAKAAGRMTQTDQIWDKTGTTAIAAHNDTFFKNVKDFENKDQILIYTRLGNFTYEVYDKKTVNANDLSVLDDIEDQKNLVLITCNALGNKRVVVFARQIGFVKVTIK